MNSLIARDKDEAKKKGMVALGTAAGSAVLFTVGWTIPAVGAAAGAAYLGYKWFLFRAKRGMRF